MSYYREQAQPNRLRYIFIDSGSFNPLIILLAD